MTQFVLLPLSHSITLNFKYSSVLWKLIHYTLCLPRTGRLTQPVERFSTSTWHSLYNSSPLGPDWKVTFDTLFCK